MKMLKDKHNFVISLALLALTGFISLPILTRILNIEQFGHLALLITIFNSIGLLELSKPIITNDFCRLSNQAQTLGHYYATIKMMTLIFSSVISVAYGILIGLLFKQLDNIELLSITFGAFTFILASQYWGILAATQRPGYAYLIRSILWVCVYVTFILLAYYQRPVAMYALTLASMNILLLITYRFSNPYKNLTGTFNKTMLIEFFHSAKHMLGFSGYRTFIDYFDRFIIAKFLPIGLFGIYSLQSELALKTNLITFSLSQFLHPKLALLKTNHSDQAALQYFSNIAIKYLIFIFIATFCGSLFAHDIIRIYAGPLYAKHAHLFILFMLGILYNTFGFLGIALQRALGDFKTSKECYRISVFISLVCCYPLCILLGLTGAAILFILLRTSGILIALKIMHDHASHNHLLFCLCVMTLMTLPYLLLYSSTMLAVIVFSAAVAALLLVYLKVSQKMKHSILLTAAQTK